jgi:hypothetical protein
MKKIITFSFIIVSIFSMKAQTTPWISQGATWFYTWSTPGLQGNDKIEYTNDTVLLGKACEVLETTRYTYAIPGPGLPIALISSQIVDTNFTYSNGDTVFYLNNNQFNVLYNFGAQVNDQWNLGVDTSTLMCSKSIVKVDSISSITINSNSHRVLYTSDSANSSIGITGEIIEHIGALQYLFPTERNCGSQIIVEFYMFNFSCFQDNTISYMLVSPAECENPYHVGVSELAIGSDKIQCSPNPVEHILNIDFLTENNYKICVYNLLGEKTVEKTNQKNQSLNIDFSDLPSGIYIATFEDGMGEKTSKRIIKK